MRLIGDNIIRIESIVLALNCQIDGSDESR